MEEIQSKEFNTLSLLSSPSLYFPSPKSRHGTGWPPRLQICIPAGGEELEGMQKWGLRCLFKELFWKSCPSVFTSDLLVSVTPTPRIVPGTVNAHMGGNEKIRGLNLHWAWGIVKTTSDLLTFHLSFLLICQMWFSVSISSPVSCLPSLLNT